MASASVPINDLRPAMSPLLGRIGESVADVLSSYWFLDGKWTKAFEKAFGGFIGCEFAVSVANGTDALEIALRAAGVERGDEVITVANAGGYTTTAVVAIGAVPCYADIELDSLLISSDSLISCVTPKTKAIVLTHLYGRVVDVAKIRALVGNDFPIIEDCAQAHGARLRGSMAGAMGDVAAFSFYPTKNLGACGDAGIVVTRDDAIATRARSLKQYGWSSRYRMDVPGGRNSRMDEIQAAILSIKLPYLEQWNWQRTVIAREYDAVLNGSLFQIYRDDGQGNVHHLYVVRHPDREQIRSQLEDRGVATAVHYPILDCDQPGMSGVCWRAGPLVSSRSAQSEIFTLPCYPGMTQADLELVIQTLREVSTL